MSVLINGMEMPTNDDMTPTDVRVYPNGAAIVFYENGKRQQYTQATPVPPHGRLGDLDALKERATKRLYASNHGSMAEAYYAAIIDLIDSAPTIIPTEPFNNLSKPCKDDADFPICTKASPASLGIYKKAEEGET